MLYLFSALLLISILVAVGLFLYSIYENAWNMFRIPVKRLSMPIDVLRRIYLVVRNVFLQGKLLKERGGGVMHFLFFWGFITFAAYSSYFFLKGLDPSIGFFVSGTLEYAIFFTVDIFAAVLLADVVYSVYRRWIRKIPRYQGYNGFEASLILILIAGLMITYYMLAVARLQGISAGIPGSILETLPAWASPISSFLASSLPRIPSSMGPTFYWVTWSVHAFIFLAFLVYIPRSKHLHLVAAPLNVLLADSKPIGELTKIDFEKDTRFGATDIRDFSWKDYLDFYACTECGRCTANCPANMTGKTLSPRDVIWDLRETVMAQGRALRHGQGEADTVLTTVIGNPIRENDLWSCTTCMACVEQCPVMIDHVDKIVEMRRSMVLNQGKAPQEALAMFSNIESYFSPYANDPASRADWAQGIEIVDLSKTPETTYEYLYWVGCLSSYDRRNQEIARSTVKLLKAAGVNFAILGAEEKCTGDPARRAGNEYLAQNMITQNVETLKKHRVQKVIATCPHCFNSLKNDYRKFGIELEVYHHTQFIDSLIRDGKLKIQAADGDKDEVFTYHDPCYLGRFNREFDAPRSLIGTFATDFREMKMNKTKSFCCGAGGGRLFMNETEGTKISHKRIEMAAEVDASTVVTACPFCMTMLDDARKVTNREENMDIKDVSELLASRIK
ncbi:MAG: (Fe-S)-binding protein [Candidatus Thermoplasmatota archaeon]|jgi:Fe-S oxidoreductase|nr:(Fe-S)-binding protein [Candidatus Thermoplasmatota archaeon]